MYENCSKVQTANCLCGVYWIEFGLKEKLFGRCFFFNCALFQAIWEVKANKK